MNSLRARKTYVYRESIRTTPQLSILLMHCPRRTMLQSHYVELSERSRDLSTGQEEKAIVERPVAAGHLGDTVGLNNERWGGKTNASSYLFRLTPGEERLYTEVRVGDAIFA